MGPKIRGAITVSIVALLVIAGVMLFYPKNDDSSVSKATIDDLLSIRSSRKSVDYDMVITSYTSPYVVLAATPLAVYFDGNQSKTAKPLLLAGTNDETPEEGISKTISSFFMDYQGRKTVVLGNIEKSVEDDLKLGNLAIRINGGSVERTTLEAAKSFWESSDGAILIEKTQGGYNIGVNAVPIASYLNIPVIITSDTENVKDTLSELGVKKTIVCGNLKGYKKTFFISNVSQVHQLLATGMEGKDGIKSILKDRIGSESVKYIALANPLDIDVPLVLEEISETFTGTIVSQGTGSTSNPSSNSNAPTHYFNIPEDYTWSNIILDTRVKYSNSPIPGRTPAMDGQRSYTYFGIDEDKDGEMVEDPDSEGDHLQFFSPSLGYEALSTSTHGYTEKPIFKSTGEHAIQLLATLHYQPNPYAPPPETSYTITIRAQKLSSPNYPLVDRISCLAPYLAAFRNGIVYACPDFSIYSEDMLGNPDCGDPSLNPDLLETANNESLEVKSKLNGLLARLRGTTVAEQADWPGLADIYREESQEPLLVGIIADTNMVPQYYYESDPQQAHYGSREGYGLPSDNFYSDIDASFEDCFSDIDGGPVSMELGIGRILGWDSQDVSALLARTFFYEDILASAMGHTGSDFKDSAMNTFGSQVPVGTSITVTSKLDTIFQHGGFTVDTIHDGPASDSKVAHPTYESSNLIFFCAHGFYYWFVPPGYKDTGVGGGFYPSNVNEMEFGPSTIFGSSCVTGKVDGLDPTNSVSLSFLHSGMNAYIGATRLSWGGFSPLSTESGEILGAYIGLYLYGYLVGEIYQRGADAFKEVNPVDSIGAALMHSKNHYVQDIGTGSSGNPHSDTVEEFNIIGDPAFMPYIPNR